ncbi:MAG: hypothetical protein J6W42_00435 [Bacteroidaceae bacterium]|nr:hypothetical protein [Bacteroidaceae bacterium]
MNRAVYKRLLSLICLSLSCTICFATDNDESPTSDSSLNTVSVQTANNGTITIEISVQDFDTIPVLIGNDKYYMVMMPEGHSTLQRGYPDLPVITKSFIIPENSSYVIRVVDDDYSDYTIPVSPSKGSILRKVNWDDVSYVFSDTYSQNSFYPSESVISGDSYYIRDIQGGNIQICPFKYNPITNTLRVYNYLKIEISFSDYMGRGSLTNELKTVNKHFYPLAKHRFINSDNYIRNESESVQQGEPLRSLDETTAKMLVVCCDSFVTEMRNFIIHKNNLGIPTTLVKMSDVGTTANQLKTFIQNAYNNDNDLTYVLLVGDAPQIPTPLIVYTEYTKICIEGTNDSLIVPYDAYGGADPLYSLVSGNDKYPDIVIGRFSASTKSEVRTMVDKVINYENQLTSNWFHIGMGIASNLQSKTSGTHGYSEADWQHMRNIRSKLLSGHYTSVSEFYDNSHGLLDSPGNPSNDMIANSVNSGVSLINYVGHGDVDRWVTSDFSNNDVQNLMNQDKLPFIFSASCLVGQFNNDTTQCFAETWQKAKMANTGDPTGCIGFYGSSITQSWSEPMSAQDSFNRQLIDEDFVTIGMLCYSAGCDMMSNCLSGEYPDIAEEMFDAWILFGDPSLHIIPNNNVGNTLFLEGDIVNDSTYTKDFVDVRNATIKNNTDIIIDCQQNTIFNGEFRVEEGSTLSVW